MLEFAAGRMRPGGLGQLRFGHRSAPPAGGLSFFVMVLCYSRMMYVEFTLSEGMEQFLACHRHAFEFFGGRAQPRS